MIWENIKMALASLRAAKLRSFLTMLGIIIGISAVVSINAVGEGVKKSVSDQITGLGTNLITITSGKTISKDSKGKTQTNFASSAGASTLTQKDLDAVGGVQHIGSVAPISLISGTVSHDTTTSQSALIIATTPRYNVVREQKFSSGRFFTNDESTKNVALLGADLKEELFGTADALGRKIRVRTTEFEVIGVIAKSDSGGGALSGPNFDAVVYLPLEAGRKLSDGNVQILRIIAQADSSDQVQPSVDRIKSVMLAGHGGQEDFSVLTQADLVSTVGGILDLLSTFVAAIASIALLVGGIGIMNMMLVTVTERTREIGIRKALGATRGTIAGQFLIEAVILSLMGGLLGIAGAYGMGTLIARVAKITPVFTLPTMGLAFGVSVGIGIIFGLAPAIKAARKRPIEALRYE
jgi:putative ABC transport system permease protein